MNSLIVALLATQIVATTPLKKDDVTYFELAEQAIFNCPAYKNKKTQIKPSVVFDLVSIERKFKVPADMRGMLLAHACTHEGLSGNISSLRYWSDIPPKAKKKSIFDITPDQKFTRFNRFHFQRTADIWMKRVIGELDKTKKKCIRNDESCSWIKAWLGSVKSYKKSPKKEIKLLKNWHRKIIDKRQASKRFACGC
tara:strand:+ start:1146 stop:1733 length:588 start_codon:yes stop_codon:yes gene_type:complete